MGSGGTGSATTPRGRMEADQPGTEEADMGRWSVADVMTVGAVSVEEGAPFKEIVDLLEAHHINAVPVVDSCHRVLGVVSSADLVPKIEFSGSGDHAHLFESRKHRAAREKSTGTAAAELMTAPAQTVL